MANQMMLVGIAVIAVVIIAAGAFLLLAQAAPKGAASGGAGLGSGVTPTTVVSGNLGSSKGGGPGQSYMSEGQAASLLGAGGTYNTSGADNAATLEQYASTNGTYANSYFKNNVTGIYIATYTVNGTNGQNRSSVLNIVLQSSKSKYLYERTLAQSNANSTNSTSPFSTLNATVNGMTYSLEQSSFGTALLGYTGNELGITLVLLKPVNGTTLADLTSQDLT